MVPSISRRDFFKIGGLSLGSLAFGPQPELPTEKPRDAIAYIRVAVSEVRIFDEPSYFSNVVRRVSRDQLLFVYEKFDSPDGPDFNPAWYRVEGGYLHTAYTQPVKTLLQEAQTLVRPEGQVFEVTVPLTQSYRNTKTYGWQKLYRLYYQSNHWVTGLETGPDGALWYQITDELLKVDYFVLASHMKPVPDSDFAPISPHVEAGRKLVEVSIAEQRLWAYEGSELVMERRISTGIPGMESDNGIPTATPRGSFNVMNKMPVRHMGDGRLTDDIAAYELPGVPWVSYFYETGVAFHGTYWHDNYGNEMSHGCVNMTPEDAKWLFRWVTPSVEATSINTNGYGTRVKVF